MGGDSGSVARHDREHGPNIRPAVPIIFRMRNMLKTPYRAFHSLTCRIRTGDNVLRQETGGSQWFQGVH